MSDEYKNGYQAGFKACQKKVTEILRMILEWKDEGGEGEVPPDILRKINSAEG